jgi:hypothetical protein
VLRHEAFPWYDEHYDRARPVLPDPSSWQKGLADRIVSFFKSVDRWLARIRIGSPGRMGAALGNSLATLLFATAGAVLAIVLWRLWRTHEPLRPSSAEGRARLGEVARMAGVDATAAEIFQPHEEALRRRASGDRAGAVIWLFIDQLVALEQAGLIRITPGRTARSYVRALADPHLGNLLGLSLGLFEDVYYGHRIPSAEAVESVWLRDQDFRRRLESMVPRP